MHIEVRPGSAAFERKGTSRRTGQAYSMRVQEMWAIFGNGEVRKVTLILNREQNAYEPGVYDIDLDASVGVNDFGDLTLTRVSLKARQAVKPAQVAGARQAG